jgi:preprotein translocase subunit SecY
MKKITAILLACLLSASLWAQEEKPGNMKENWDAGLVNTLKQSGGVYAVILVIAIILAGFFWYMTRLERKITRLENEQKK